MSGYRVGDYHYKQAGLADYVPASPQYATGLRDTLLKRCFLQSFACPEHEGSAMAFTLIAIV